MGRCLTVTIVLLLLLPAVQAQLTCNVKTSCSEDETRILRLSNWTNAHAENYTFINYSYLLCCSENIGYVDIKRDCTGTRYKDFDYIINLSAGTNAHAALPNQTINYPQPVCIGLVSNGWNASGSSAVHCFDNSTCNPPYTAMVSLSNFTNAHLGNATAYPLKICCKLDPDVTGPVTTTAEIDNGSVVGSPAVFHLNCHDNQTGYDQSGCKSTTWCNATGWTSICAPTTNYVNNITLIAPPGGEIKYRIRFNSTDHAGNPGPISEINITVSDLLPTCNFDLQPNRYTNQTLLSYNWTGDKKAYDEITKYYLNWTVVNVSNTSDVRSYTLAFDPDNRSWNLTGSNEQEFSVRCITEAKKIETGQIANGSSASAITLIDTKQPTATISLPPFVTIPTDPGNFTVSWSGQDGNGSGILKYQLFNSTTQSNCSNDTGWTPWLETNESSANFTGTQATRYYFRIRAIDRAGNVGNWSCNSTMVKGVVQINITLIGTNTTVRTGQNLLKLGQNVTINVSAYAAIGIKSIDLIYTNATAWLVEKANTTKYWNMSWKLAPNQTGNYTIKINLTDESGDSNYKDANFTVVECFAGTNWSESQSCGTDVGECIKGEQYCSNETLTWSDCLGGIEPAEEICNDGLDTDCDGSNATNEQGCTTLTCTSGETRPCAGLNTTWSLSKCYGAVQDCSNNTWGPCNVSTSSEICNAIDDNCNGQLNEGIANCCEPNGAIEYTDGYLQQFNGTGICRVGMRKCDLTQGGWIILQNATFPTTDQAGIRTELAKDCNDGLDNDCDNKTDSNDSDCGFTLGGLIDFWWLLIGAGGAILAVVLFLFFKFRARGEELTWENLMKRYGG